MDVVGVLRAIVAVALLAWLPGFAWTHGIRGKLTGIERFVVSVVLSVSLIVLALYLGDVLLGIRVSGLTAVLYSLVFAAVGYAFPLARWLDGVVSRSLEPSQR